MSDIDWRYARTDSFHPDVIRSIIAHWLSPESAFKSAALNVWREEQVGYWRQRLAEVLS